MRGSIKQNNPKFHLYPGVPVWVLKEIREEMYWTVFLGFSCVKTLQCSYMLDFVYDFTDFCCCIVIKAILVKLIMKAD